MKRKLRKIAIVLMFIIGLSSCQSQQSEKIKVIEKQQFAKAIQEKVQLVDVRTSSEFEQGAIANALNIDVNSDTFVEDISKLDKSKPVYIYCRSGSRSQKAAQKMVALGFEEIIDLDGGYMNW